MLGRVSKIIYRTWLAALPIHKTYVDIAIDSSSSFCFVFTVSKRDEKRDVRRSKSTSFIYVCRTRAFIIV